MKRLFIYLILACTALTAWGQTMDELLQKANAGDAQAQYEMGIICYSNGIDGNEKSYREAINWFMKAADQGHVAALYYVGLCFINGTGCEKSKAYDKLGVICLKKSAEQGFAQAQNELGCCYLYGEGVTKNEKEAEKLFFQALKNGDNDAYFSLGLLYERSDKEKAVYYYKKHMDAWYKTFGKQNPTTAENLRKLGVEYNPASPSPSSGYNNSMANRQESTDSQTGPTDPVDQYNLGVDYYQKKDYDKAAYWFEKAAEQGLAEAQLNLGHIYYNYNDIGVSSDWEKALYWYEKAALQGNAKAQTQTGIITHLYKRDDEKAIYWWKKAAAQGEETAIEMLELFKKQEN